MRKTGSKTNLPMERFKNKIWIILIPLALVTLSVFSATLLILHVDRLIPLIAGLILALLSLLSGIAVSKLLPETKKLKSRAKQLEAVHRVIQKAGSSLELQEVLDNITELTVEFTGVRGCSIKLFDPSTGTMRVRSIAGIKREVPDLSVDVAENIYHRGLINGKPVVIEEAFKKDFPELDEDTESLICVPLRLEKKPIGALCIYGKKGEHLSKEMLSFLSSLGELATLAIANATVYENLKKLDDAKTWFLLKASHELKSPLNVIQSISKLLIDGYVGTLTEKQKELVARISSRANALAETVKDLISLAKGKAEIENTEREKINLCDIMEEAIKFYSSKAEEKHIQLEIICTTEKSIIYGVREGLESIVTNLLSNAIKYTPEGGKVTLRMLGEKDRVIIEVSDTGIGIPKEEQKKLFSEFFRASNAKALTESGTGLGLSIVKANVEKHGGKIEFQSEEGKGTTFRVTLKRIGNRN